MRHRKRTAKFNRNASHRRCMIANMLKNLVEHEAIETTVPKAKELRRHADRLITNAKKNTLSSRRSVISKMMIRFNPLTSKEQRTAKNGDYSAYNVDRKLVGKLFDQLAPRYASRDGGYTQIIRTSTRQGDGSQRCIIKYVSEVSAATPVSA